MENIQILKLAYYGALDIWAREHDRLQNDPKNEITRFREEKANRELNEIRDLLHKEEQKQQSF